MRPGGGENPYLIHQELGQVMTKAATVVRHNDVLDEAYDEVHEARPVGPEAARSPTRATGRTRTLCSPKP